jgi:EAL domain-containing protein (putative c-di-GMP-specific phosphodiesterase class I)
MGVRADIDDFGTGYSSLAYLQRLPIDAVKIDRSFVGRMASDEGSAAIVRSTVELCHSLGLPVVAEGVEDLQTWERLAAMGCDEAQGYYVSAALAAPELERWLAGRGRGETALRRSRSPVPIGRTGPRRR